MHGYRRLTSRDNPLLKRVRALAHQARERRHEGRTLLDGAHLLTAALDARWPLEHVLVSEAAQHHPEIQHLLARFPAEVDVASIPSSLFKPLSPVDTPSGIVAVIAPPEAPAAVSFTHDLLVLEGIQDPGNLGSILRTAAASGVRDVLLTPGCARAWSPRCLRAGMGGHFMLAIHEEVDALSALRDFPGTVLATRLAPDSVPLYELACLARADAPVAWLFGGEGAGLSATLSQRADVGVRIPMPGAVESLNVGAAVAICLFEGVRQRSAGASKRQS